MTAAWTNGDDGGVLFKQRFWPGLADGSITLTFRTWTRPQVKPGRQYRSPAGMLVVDAVDQVELADITEADARRAGCADLGELLGQLHDQRRDQSRDQRRQQLDDAGATLVYRIELHPGGPDPRDELRARADLGAADLRALTKRLDRLDRASTSGPWTRAALGLIADHPARRAGDLADMVDRELLPFKLDVRKLKALGLTESLKVGYRLSPRGRALLDALEGDRS